MTTDPLGKPIEILLVEDSPGDMRLTKEALKDAKMLNHLSTCPDGVEAMAFLRHEGKYTDSPRPDLILLDLNMPKVDGLDVLRKIRDDEKLNSVHVIVLTSSHEERDIVESHRLGVISYIVKPVNFGELIGAAKELGSFWAILDDEWKK